MSDKSTPKTATILTTTAIGASTSAQFPLARGPISYQATVVTVGTGTTGVLATAVLNVSNDNQIYLPVSTAIGTGTVAAAGTSTGSCSAIGSLGASYPFKYAKLVVTTTAAANSSPALNGSITQ